MRGAERHHRQQHAARGESLEDKFKRLGVGAIEEYAEFLPPGSQARRASRSSMPASRLSAAARKARS